MKIFQTGALALLLMFTLFFGRANAGVTDISYGPQYPTDGADFNHSPVGQTFIAVAPQVRAGIFIADAISSIDCSILNLPENVTTQAIYPDYMVPSITATLSLLEGAGTDGVVINSQTITVDAPFMGFIEVDYAALGIELIKGNSYTLLLTHVVPTGVSPDSPTGWHIPYTRVRDINKFINFGANGIFPGAYPEGMQISQGVFAPSYFSADLTFHVIDVNGIMANTPSVLPCERVISGTLPDGEINVPYTATLSFPNSQSYIWSENLSIPGLTLSDGVFSGTPTEPGVYSGDVTLTDATGVYARTPYRVEIGPIVAVPPTPTPIPTDPTPPPQPDEENCTLPNGAAEAAGNGMITEVGDSYIVIDGGTTVNYRTCSSLNYSGSAQGFVVGHPVQWEGWSLDGNNVGKAISME